MPVKYIYLLFFIPIFSGYGCKKFLEGKSNQRLDVPSTTKDLQSIIDNTSDINYRDPNSGEGSADNAYATDANFNSFDLQSQQLYKWLNNNVFVQGTNDWSYCYDNVNRANTILDLVAQGNITSVNNIDVNNIKGQALFLRGRSFFSIAAIWTLAYDSLTADKDLGIPLRLSADFNIKSTRSTNRQTYLQIIKDLQESVPLLPLKSISPVRASKQSAWGMLARTYLSMRNYNLALLYADSVLAINNQLWDYNTIDLTNFYALPPLNIEVVFEAGMSPSTLLYPGLAYTDSILYNSYEPTDLRKKIFFAPNPDSTVSFLGGSYSLAYGYFFTGIATDEMYLISAECNARMGNVPNAMHELNILLHARYQTGTYADQSSSSGEEALKIILKERRKELIMRGLRWGDIKRLNKAGENITLLRNIDNTTYTLIPNSPRYAVPLPDDIIVLSGMAQNAY